MADTVDEQDYSEVQWLSFIFRQSAMTTAALETTNASLLTMNAHLAEMVKCLRRRAPSNHVHVHNSHARHADIADSPSSASDVSDPSEKSDEAVTPPPKTSRKDRHRAKAAHKARDKAAKIAAKLCAPKNAKAAKKAAAAALGIPGDGRSGFNRSAKYPALTSQDPDSSIYRQSLYGEVVEDATVFVKDKNTLIFVRAKVARCGPVFATLTFEGFTGVKEQKRIRNTCCWMPIAGHDASPIAARAPSAVAAVTDDVAIGPGY
jgi:hypothetical protein